MTPCSHGHLHHPPRRRASAAAHGLSPPEPPPDPPAACRYDGALRIGTPPRLYSQNVDVVVVDRVRMRDKNVQKGADLAKLYAMTHVAMADATIAVRSPVAARCSMTVP